MFPQLPIYQWIQIGRMNSWVGCMPAAQDSKLGPLINSLVYLSQHHRTAFCVGMQRNCLLKCALSLTVSNYFQASFLCIFQHLQPFSYNNKKYTPVDKKVYHSISWLLWWWWFHLHLDSDEDICTPKAHSGRPIGSGYKTCLNLQLSVVQSLTAINTDAQLRRVGMVINWLVW